RLDRKLMSRTSASQARPSSNVAEFRRDVIAGLSSTPKTLPSKYFYDRRGSQLFDEICELDEYYLTRTEQSIMDEYAGAMAERIAEEFGDIEVIPMHGDFNRQLTAPECETEVDRRIVYFPGSTIGNLVPAGAEALLTRIVRLVGKGGGLLIGLDLEKDPAV